MTVVHTLAPYQDDRGNTIEFGGEPVDKDVWIRMRGSNNTLVVHKEARLKGLKVFFDSDNGRVEIGPSTKGLPMLSVTVRAGLDATVRLGRDVSSTSRAYVSATEGTSVVIGNDVMLATGNELRADDAHAIFDVDTGERVNVSRSIVVGDHVWLSKDVVVLGGVTIGSGTVVGYRSVVTRSLPNNCVAVGTPAHVIRKNVAWERPHLDSYPGYRPNASTIVKSKYWAHTEGSTAPVPDSLTPRVIPHPGVPRARRLRRVLGRAARAMGLRRRR